MNYNFRTAASTVSGKIRRAAYDAVKRTEPVVCVEEQAGMREKIGERCAENGYSRVMVITNKRLVKSNLISAVTDSLDEASILYDIYDGVRSVLKLSMVEAASEQGSAIDAQCVIAIGGGAAIDCAKLTATALNAKVIPLRVLRLRLISTTLRQSPVIVIPATAGTGAEMVAGSRILNEKKMRLTTAGSIKCGFRNVFLDSEMLYETSREEMAEAGIEVLVRSLEGYLSDIKMTEEEELEFVDGIHLCMANLKNACEEEVDKKARKNMLLAANYGGRALRLGGEGYASAFASEIESLYYIGRGQALAATITEYLRFVQVRCRTKLAILAIACNLGNEDSSIDDNAAVFIDSVESLISAIGLKPYCSHIMCSDFGRIIYEALNSAAVCSLPKIMKYEEATEFLNSISKCAYVEYEKAAIAIENVRQAHIKRLANKGLKVSAYMLAGATVMRMARRLMFKARNR